VADGRRLWVIGGAHVPAAETGFFTNTDLLLDPKRAAFADYLRTPAVYRCPSDRTQANLPEGRGRRVRTYALNSYLAFEGAPQAINSTSYWTFMKTADLAAASPSQLLQFVDTAPGNVCHSAFVIHLGGFNGLFYHLPSAQHGRSGLASFVDGHVEAQPLLESFTRRSKDEDWIPNHFTAYDPGNRDLEWLKQRASVRRF
jgi:hypothetical protein